MTKFFEDVTNDLEIDPYALDKEAVTHSFLFFRYMDTAATCRAEVNKISDNLKLRLGQADVEVRNFFIKKEVKFTESLVHAEVEKDEIVLKIREELRLAELNLARAQAAVSAMEHRKAMLDNLIKLYLAGYYSRPSTSGGQGGGNELGAKNAREKLNQKKQKQ